MKYLALCLILLTLFSQNSFSNTLDQQIEALVKEHNLIPLDPIKRDEVELVRLGAMLFHETELSGERNISCNICHHPRFGTGDALPFSIGEGGEGIGTNRKQMSGGVTKRHSPHLINLGYSDIEHMFWDGRVFRDESTGELQTPEPALNGKNPKLDKIAKTFSMSLSVQTIFPIVNDLEMKGPKGNDISNTKNNEEAWEAVMKRLTKGVKSERYMAQFQKAFPKDKEFHIGHVGESLGIFLKNNFNLVNTPYDSYLKGNRDAMNESEKRGLVVFATKGKCVECHQGRHLSNFEFKSVGVPQFTWEKIKAPYDQGRYEVTTNKEDLFKFRTPPLRNISITAPFMHNGVFSTLEEVIQHYTHPRRSIHHFDMSKIDLSAYADKFIFDSDRERNMVRINSIDIPEVRRGVDLSVQEREDLLKFLSTGLLDYRLQKDRL